MQRASSGQSIAVTEIVEGADAPTGGQVIGINLGYDFCGEHEMGIAGLYQRFGIAGRPERRDGGDFVGADVRTNTQVPEHLKFLPDLEGYAYLIYSTGFQYNKPGDVITAQ